MDNFEPKYNPFGTSRPKWNDLYETHKTYVENKIMETKDQSSTQTYYCKECNKNLNSCSPSILRRHFVSYKHLINAKIIDKKPDPVLVASFNESIDEGYVFN